MVKLPIHDSYIVRNRSTDKGELMEAMGEALWKLAGDGRPDRSVGGKTFHNMEEIRMGRSWEVAGDSESEREHGKPIDLTQGPAGRIHDHLPRGAQRDLFGADYFNVPYREIFGSARRGRSSWRSKSSSPRDAAARPPTP